MVVVVMVRTAASVVCVKVNVGIKTGEQSSARRIKERRATIVRGGGGVADLSRGGRSD